MGYILRVQCISEFKCTPPSEVCPQWFGWNLDHNGVVYILHITKKHVRKVFDVYNFKTTKTTIHMVSKCKGASTVFTHHYWIYEVRITSIPDMVPSDSLKFLHSTPSTSIASARIFRQPQVVCYGTFNVVSDAWSLTHPTKQFDFCS